MKKIITLFLLLISIGTVSAKSKLKGDIDAGAIFNYLKLYEKHSNYEKKRIGAYVTGTLEFNDYFGLFLDNNYLFLYEKNDYDFYINTSFLLGVCGIIPVTDKFKIKIGVGYDESINFTEEKYKNMQRIYLLHDYSTEYYYDVNYKDFTITNLMGIGAKLSGTLLLNDYVGLNFGVKGSYYFGGFKEVYSDKEDKLHYTLSYEEDAKIYWFSSKCFSITPELGVTFHLERRGNSGKVKNNDLSAKDDIEL